ncbi:MAG TPA: tetratricopeptide repeat protein [Verrucomicrobiae bacterium]|nr:tetratricopeptide repeat protein [Verrucomicrobiae bacterium]
MAVRRSSKFYTPAEMEKMFKEVFGPRLLQLGFQYIGKNRWVRETGLGFKHLFYFHPFRAGADYYPYGAISFDFAPRIERGKVRLRPEPKHARPHLVIADDFRHGGALGIHRQRPSARERCEAVSETAITGINRCLESVKSLDHALDAFEHASDDLGNEFYGNPELVLALAFTLAKIGQMDDAQSELSKILEHKYFAPATHAPLRDFLAKCESIA